MVSTLIRELLLQWALTLVIIFAYNKEEGENNKELLTYP